LIDHIDDVDVAYRLIELRQDAAMVLELDALRYGNPDTSRLRALFTELQFTRFLDMLEADDSQPAEPAPQPVIEMITATSAEDLDQLAARVKETKTLALVALGPGQEPMRMPLTGLALSAAVGQAYYLPVGHRVLTAVKQIDLELLRSKLGPLLADPDIAKVGHDLKTSRVVLARHGLTVDRGRFDSMVASYLLDPEAAHKLSKVVQRDLGVQLTELEQLMPKKRKGPKLTIEDLEIDTVAGYACASCEAVLRLHQQQSEALETAGLTSLQDELEMPVLEVLVQMELVGVQVSPEPLAQLSESMAVELRQLEQEAFKAAGRELNLASPKQLETVLFDELGLRATRKTKTGRSTDHEALEAIASAHPLPKLVLEHRAVAKLKGTYVDALPKLIHPDTGRIHTHWDQAVTATGRLSSKEPNLQNVPIRTAHGKRIREAFTAPEGMLILSADYSQIELRVLAHLSRDPKLVEAFNSGQDVHVRTAMEVFGVAQDEVTETMRAQSKTVNFGVIYGMGPVALGKRLGISRKEAKGFIDAYFERYGGVREFMERTLAEARDKLAVRTLLGRRRLLPDLRSSNRVRRAYAERIAQNTPIQGTAADLLKLAMVRLAKPVEEGVRMVLTVHDELVFEAPQTQIEQVAAKTKAAMESVHPLDVPLIVDVGWGKTWADAH